MGGGWIGWSGSDTLPQTKETAMSNPWTGKATRLTDADYAAAAAEIGVDVATIRAVWEVEAGGRPFRADGTLERRYEPHHFPGSGITNWRESLQLPTLTRERMFADAFAKNPEQAMRATSWGGPQIMGFNHLDAWFPSARAMVEAMAQSEKAQLAAFVGFVQSKRLVPALQRRDWLAFATRYNGDGQAETYARKLRDAYSRQRGLGDPLLRRGSTGEAVRRLQAALGVAADGSFGPATEAAVRAFQRSKGLTSDGIVGPSTWAALNTPDLVEVRTPIGQASPIIPPATTSGGPTIALVIAGALAALLAVIGLR